MESNFLRDQRCHVCRVRGGWLSRHFHCKVMLTPWQRIDWICCSFRNRRVRYGRMGNVKICVLHHGRFIWCKIYLMWWSVNRTEIYLAVYLLFLKLLDIHNLHMFQSHTADFSLHIIILHGEWPKCSALKCGLQ